MNDLDIIITTTFNRLFPDNYIANTIHEFLGCTRCRSSEWSGLCQVPHAVHLRQDRGGLFSRETLENNFFCGACSSDFSLVTHRDSGMTEVRGAKWCFEGKHTHAELPPTDQRRVFAKAVALEFGPSLQQQIDELPLDLETLTISSLGYYDSSLNFVLDRPLPTLQRLQLVDIHFTKINLIPALTPNIRTLRMQNVPEDCELTVKLPELRQVEVHYWSGNESSIREMLATATKLESFNSYKLRSNQHLDFASPELTSIDLHRSDTLSSVSIWAPKLIHLGLQACYNLQNIEFLDSHPLSSKLPTSFACRAPLVVNTANALLSFRAKRALHDHPRAVPAAQRHPGLATESTFAQMHDMADGDDYDWYHNSEWPGDIEDFYGEEDDLGSVGEDFVGDDDDEMEEFDDGVDFE